MCRELITILKIMNRTIIWQASQVALVVKNPPVNAGDATNSGSILGVGRSHGIGNGNLL